MEVKHIFISMLGTTDYSETTYYLEHLPPHSGTKTKFVQEALLKQLPKYFDFEQWHKIFIILTPDAKAKNWERGGKLKERLESSEYKKAIIPMDCDTDNLWGVLSNIYQELVKEREGQQHLYIDITHAFRHMPMFMMVVIHYLEVLIDGLKLKGIYYGKYEQGKSETPIKDLTSYNTLMHLIQAAHAFKVYGRVSELQELIEELRNTRRNELKASGKENQIGQDPLIQLISKLTKLDDVIETIVLCRGTELYKGFNELEHYAEEADKIFKKIGRESTMAHAFKPLFDVFKEKIQRLNAKGKGANRLFEAAKFAYEHKLYQQAVTLLTEWLITYCIEQCASSGGEKDLLTKVTDYKVRECYRKALIEIARSKSGKYKKETCEQRNTDEAGEIQKCVEVLKKCFSEEQLEKIASLYFEELGQLRNDINHAGFSKNPISKDKIQERLDRIFKDIEKWLDGGS